ncbi:unnamed protein product [Phytomonas sp. EM1]|nr:unnamed protein product [Phytomonas sp. EM1]|eukprot:CCW60293.1 unnamed protein product [Phytomonas sp. isolate EM1]
MSLDSYHFSMSLVGIRCYTICLRFVSSVSIHLFLDFALSSHMLIRIAKLHNPKITRPKKTVFRSEGRSKPLVNGNTI